jgi:hypothetical protein
MPMRKMFTGNVKLFERESIIRDLADVFRGEWEIVDRITINNNGAVVVVTADGNGDISGLSVNIRKGTGFGFLRELGTSL